MTRYGASSVPTSRSSASPGATSTTGRPTPAQTSSIVGAPFDGGRRTGPGPVSGRGDPAGLLPPLDGSRPTWRCGSTRSQICGGRRRRRRDVLGRHRDRAAEPRGGRLQGRRQPARSRWSSAATTPIAFPDATGVARHHGFGRVVDDPLRRARGHRRHRVRPLYGHGQPMRRLIESGAIRGDRFLQLGLRGYWPGPETLGWMADQRMRSYEMTEVVARGLEECLTEAFAIALDDCDGVFLSVDVDVVRPGPRPGHRHAGARRPDPRELLDAVRRICYELPVVGWRSSKSLRPTTTRTSRRLWATASSLKHSPRWPGDGVPTRPGEWRAGAWDPRQPLLDGAVARSGPHPELELSRSSRHAHITSQNEDRVCPRLDFPKPPGLGHTVEVARPSAPFHGCARSSDRTGRGRGPHAIAQASRIAAARDCGEGGAVPRNPDPAGEAMSHARGISRRCRATRPTAWTGGGRTSRTKHRGTHTMWNAANPVVTVGLQPPIAGSVDASSTRHRSGTADADAGQQVQVQTEGEGTKQPWRDRRSASGSRPTTTR